MNDITPQDYANDAVKGAQLQRFASDMAKDMYVDIPQAVANALNDLNARLLALESEDQNIGDVKADTLDAQSLKVGGVDVKTRQSAKSSPSAGSTGALSFIDTITQNENGEITATKKTLQTATGSRAGSMSAAHYTKLEGIAAGAEVNVQADWTENDNSSDAFIQHKPQNLVQDASYVHTDNNFSSEYKSKVDTAYQKDANGIPKTDLASAVQTSLGKADTALQNHQSVTDSDPTLAWCTRSKVGSVGSTDLHVTMPTNPASGKLETNGDGKDLTVTYTAQSSGDPSNISSGSTLSAIFAKIQYWFTKFGSLAWKSNITDSDISGNISDNHIASASTWSGKQNALPTSGSASSTYAINISGNADTAGVADLAKAVLDSSGTQGQNGYKVVLVNTDSIAIYKRENGDDLTTSLSKDGISTSGTVAAGGNISTTSNISASGDISTISGSVFGKSAVNTDGLLGAKNGLVVAPDWTNPTKGIGVSFNSSLGNNNILVYGSSNIVMGTGKLLGTATNADGIGGYTISVGSYVATANVLSFV